MPSCVVGVFGETKSGKKELVQLLSRQTVPISPVEAIRQTGMFLRTAARECLTQRVEFVYVPSHSEVLFQHATQVASSSDAAVIVLDVLVGCTPAITHLLEAARQANSPILLFINKIDLDHLSPRQLLAAIDEIIFQAQSTTAAFSLAIGSVKYQLLVYHGAAHAYQAAISTTAGQLHELREAIRTAQAHPKALKQYLWANQLLNVIDKSSPAYRADKLTSTVSDILVHTFKCASLVHTVLEWCTTCQGSAGTWQHTPQLLGFTEHQGESALIVRAAAVAQSSLLKTSLADYLVTQVLKQSPPAGSLFLVRIDSPQRLKLELEQPLLSRHIMYLDLNGLSPAELSIVEQHTLAYPVVMLRQQSGAVISSTGPIYLETFLYTLKSKLSLKPAQLSLPKYYCRQTVASTPAQLAVAVAGHSWVVELTTTFPDGSPRPSSAAAPSHYWIDRFNHCSCTIFTTDQTAEEAEHAQLVAVVEDALRTVQADPETPQLAYLHLSVTPTASGSLLTLPDKYYLSKKLEIFLRRSAADSITQQLVLHLTLHLPQSHFPATVLASLPFRASPSVGGKAMMKLLVKECQGSIIATKKQHALLLTSHLALPSVNYPLFLALLASVFQSHICTITSVQHLR